MSLVYLVLQINSFKNVSGLLVSLCHYIAVHLNLQYLKRSIDAIPLKLKSMFLFYSVFKAIFPQESSQMKVNNLQLPVNTAQKKYIMNNNSVL